MHVDWRLTESYAEIGGQSTLQTAIQDALTCLPQEHLRRLDALVLLDRDPKRRSLGLWRQDHSGCAIEIYIEPHLQELWKLPKPVGAFALRLHLAYTLFHELSKGVLPFTMGRRRRYVFKVASAGPVLAVARTGFRY